MKTSARRPGHRRIRIVRNLRVLVAAPAPRAARRMRTGSPLA
ncbi:hypothetical protein [Streptomyces sp. S-9]|nr:hypothetical protein [Streptomyces sp. S-9]